MQKTVPCAWSKCMGRTLIAKSLCCYSVVYSKIQPSFGSKRPILNIKIKFIAVAILYLLAMLFIIGTPKTSVACTIDCIPCAACRAPHFQYYVQAFLQTVTWCFGGGEDLAVHYGGAQWNFKLWGLFNVSGECGSILVDSYQYIMKWHASESKHVMVAQAMSLMPRISDWMSDPFWLFCSPSVQRVQCALRRHVIITQGVHGWRILSFIYWKHGWYLPLKNCNCYSMTDLMDELVVVMIISSHVMPVV